MVGIIIFPICLSEKNIPAGIIGIFLSIFFIFIYYKLYKWYKNYSKKTDILTNEDSYINTINSLQNKIKELENSNNELINKLNKYDSTDKVKKINEDIQKLLKEKSNLEKELLSLNDTTILENINLYNYDNIPSQELKNKLQLLTIEQENLIRENKAVFYNTNVTDSKKLIANKKQILRCFNLECKSIFDSLSFKNIESSRNKILKSYNSLNSIFSIDGVKLTETLFESKLKELTLLYEYLIRTEEENEQKRLIKEKLIEEEKVRREIEKEKIRIEKEENQFKNEISKLMKYLSSSQNDIEKQLYIDKIRELEDKIKDLESVKNDVLNRESNTRAGYVYIISNIGSFGENIYKIGMTRRLEPMDRIKELSDASVPFQFDVHAMIFSEDAPALETVLHQTFKNNQVNKLNPRKEFYNIDLSKIKEIVKNNYNNTVNFIDYAEAYEYRESQKILEKLN